MKCKNCNSEIVDGSKFCENCGQAVDGDNNIKEKKKISKIIRDRISRIDKKVKVFFIVFVVYLFLLLLSIVLKKTFSIIFSSISIILLILFVLLEKSVIKSKKKYTKLIVVLLFALFSLAYVGGLWQNTNPKYKWNSIILKNVIDKPNSKYGEITHNDQQYLSMYIYDIDETAYKSYILSCVDRGFVNNTEKTDSSFFSNNQDGYQISIFYFKSEEKMAMYLQAPKQMTSLSWPQNNLAKMIPSFDEAIGSIIENNDKTLDMIIGNMSIENYKEYVSQCQNMGFNYALNLSNQNYSATNQAGYQISVDYLSNNRMRIILQAPNYNINMTINCHKNSFFSKYDIIVYYDEEIVSTVKHGETASFEITSDIGKHFIRFVNKDNEKIEKTIEIDVGKPITVLYQLKCKAGSIEIIE